MPDRKSPLRKSMEARIADLEADLRATDVGGGARAMQRRRINAQLKPLRARLVEIEAAAAQGAERRRRREAKARSDATARSLGIR